MGLLLLLLILVLSGCGMESYREIGKGNPTPRDFLEQDDADIFVLEGIVYTNAQEIEWVQELVYTLGDEIGEIRNKTDKAWNFRHGSANKLPVGTKIYATGTPAYIVVVDGTEIPYIGMYEG